MFYQCVHWAWLFRPQAIPIPLFTRASPTWSLLPQFYCQNIKHLYPLSILVTSEKRNRIAASVSAVAVVAAAVGVDAAEADTIFPAPT